MLIGHWDLIIVVWIVASDNYVLTKLRCSKRSQKWCQPRNLFAIPRLELGKSEVIIHMPLKQWFPKSSMEGGNHLSICGGNLQQQYYPHNCTAPGDGFFLPLPTSSAGVLQCLGGLGNTAEGSPIRQTYQNKRRSLTVLQRKQEMPF